MSKNKSEDVFPEILTLLEKLVEDQKASGFQIRSCLEEAKNFMKQNKSAFYIENDEVTKVVIDINSSTLKTNNQNVLPSF